MSLVNDGSGMVMPVGPMYGNGNGGSFGWGGDGSQMTQEQFNQLSQMASQFQNMIGR